MVGSKHFLRRQNAEKFWFSQFGGAFSLFSKIKITAGTQLMSQGTCRDWSRAPLWKGKIFKIFPFFFGSYADKLDKNVIFSKFLTLFRRRNSPTFSSESVTGDVQTAWEICYTRTFQINMTWGLIFFYNFLERVDLLSGYWFHTPASRHMTNISNKYDVQYCSCCILDLLAKMMKLIFV